MKRIIAAGLVALATACGSEDAEQPIQYGAPVDPTYDEQDAAATAQTTLEGSLAFAPSSTPEYGAPGLADQLLASLGGYVAAKAMPTPAARKLAARAVSQAIDTGGIDPACVTSTETSVTWTGCTDTLTMTDGVTTTTMTVTVAGTMSWTPGTGTTAWNVHETMLMSQTGGGESMTVDVSVDLTGSLAVTASTIVGETASDVAARMDYDGFRMNEAYRTTLALDLGYVTDPAFCITSGTLALEQRWTERPAGANEASLPNQGWRFEWAGCGLFTVAHGS